MTPEAQVSAALALLAIDPAGLGGIWLRARAGPVRERVTSSLRSPLPTRRIHPSTNDDALFGGVDLTATLTEGRVVNARGILADPVTLLLPMAERTEPGLAARLAQALDTGQHCLVALDEGASAEEALPAALTDRLAFHLSLEGVRLDEIPVAKIVPHKPVAIPSDAIARLTATAAALGIDGLRAPLLALKAAKAAAVLAGRDRVEVADLECATALVLAPRATVLPIDPEDAPPEDVPNPEEQGEGQTSDVPEDLLLDAAHAALPPDILERIAMGAARGGSAAHGSGAKQKGNRRGRPLPSRRGRLSGANRLDLIGTLRAAAPWQPMRKKAALVERFLHIRPDDFRIRRYEDKRDRVLIFAVDASGSAAMTRLAETKGAIELLLAEAYARRDHVALVAFRGTEAELLLPPTRSLVQTKRRLTALPGGGGTPLAAGLTLAMQMGQQAVSRGMTPSLVLMTDGAANIALSGQADRAAAMADAETLADAIRRTNLPAMVIDTGPRPRDALARIAARLDATYLPMPRADSAAVSKAVSTHLPDTT